MEVCHYRLCADDHFEPGLGKYSPILITIMDIKCNVLFLAGWDKVIRLAAIDCSVTENLVPCREHNIQGFPTLLVCI